MICIFYVIIIFIFKLEKNEKRENYKPKQSGASIVWLCDKESESEITGSLSISVTSIPNLEISGDGEVNISEKELIFIETTEKLKT